MDVALLALLAGALTTTAGMGGGMVMVLGLSVTRPVGEALLITTIPLLVGNMHRIRLYASELHRPDALRYAIGGSLGAAVGSQVAAELPDEVLRIGIACIAIMAAIKLTSDAPWVFPASWVGAGSVAVGMISATVGGGGILAGPMMLGRGHTGARYVGTAAAGAAAIHIVRIIGYSTAGWDMRTVMTESAIATFMLLSGNIAGHHIRTRLSTRSTHRVEIGSVMMCASMVVAGFLFRP